MDAFLLGHGVLSRKFQITCTYKIILCGGKMVKIGTLFSRKSSKDPSWLAMCNVYFRNKLPTGLLVHYDIQYKGDILPIRTCSDLFSVLFVYRHCHE